MSCSKRLMGWSLVGFDIFEGFWICVLGFCFVLFIKCAALKLILIYFPSCWNHQFLFFKTFSTHYPQHVGYRFFCILTRPWSTRKNAIWQGLFKRLEKAMKASAVSKFKINTAAMNDMPCTWRKEKCKKVRRCPLAITVLYCLILSSCSLVFTELLHLEKCSEKQNFLTHMPLAITCSVHGG